MPRRREPLEDPVQLWCCCFDVEGGFCEPPNAIAGPYVSPCGPFRRQRCRIIPVGPWAIKQPICITEDPQKGIELVPVIPYRSWGQTRISQTGLFEREVSLVENDAAEELVKLSHEVCASGVELRLVQGRVMPVYSSFPIFKQLRPWATSGVSVGARWNQAYPGGVYRVHPESDELCQQWLQLVA